MLRMVTGMVVTVLAGVEPMIEVNSIEPALSPGDAGVVALTWTVLLLPGWRLKSDGVIEPSERYPWVAARHGMVPLVPLSAATSLKMTPVQVPATGRVTSALPKFPTPCGSECPANRPFGSMRISRTRALLPLAGLPG